MGARLFPVWGILALAGCASGGRSEPPKIPELPAASSRPEHGDEIVALLNGEPLSWNTVAEKMLELDLKTAVDQYVRWRLVEDRRKTLGIVHSAVELRRRAEAYARTLRRELGEEAFRARLAEEGTGEETWLSRLTASRFLNEMLTLDKILRYNALLEDTLETDRVMFVEELDAKKFVEKAREKGFEKAAGELEKEGDRKQTQGRRPREVFTRKAPPTDPPLDDWIVEALLKLKPGEFTGVEHSRTNLHYVVQLRNLRKGRPVTYDEIKGEVMEGILSDPPSPAEYRAWIDRELAACRIEYGERKASPGKAR